MPVGEVQMFLAVALNEGANLTELAEMMDMKKSTASRYLLDLSEKVRTGERGFGYRLRREVGQRTGLFVPV
jgi:DNA-binding IclR family transcriptional regulator